MLSKPLTLGEPLATIITLPAHIIELAGVQDRSVLRKQRRCIAARDIVAGLSPVLTACNDDFVNHFFSVFV